MKKILLMLAVCLALGVLADQAFAGGCGYRGGYGYGYGGGGGGGGYYARPVYAPAYYYARPLYSSRHSYYRGYPQGGFGPYYGAGYGYGRGFYGGRSYISFGFGY